MESTRPIRALVRGLDALTVLNSRDGATVSEVARQIRLPRTTVYRILETLCDAGFAFRDGSDERYRLTILVRGLSEGFDDDAWVADIGKPAIDELGRDILWPVSLATFDGNAMMIRAATDHETPLALERYSAGFRLPLAGSTAGQVYLAFSAPRSEHDRELAQVFAQGYATATGTRHLTEEAQLSVPVLVNLRVFAVLTTRFAITAVSLKSGIERFLPKLGHCAGKMAQRMAEQQVKADTSARAAPGAAA